MEYYYLHLNFPYVYCLPDPGLTALLALHFLDPDLRRGHDVSHNRWLPHPCIFRASVALVIRGTASPLSAVRVVSRYNLILNHWNNCAGNLDSRQQEEATLSVATAHQMVH